MNRLGLLVIPLLLSSCVTTYRDFPKGMQDRPPRQGSHGVMHYQIKPFPVLGFGKGRQALHRAFQMRSGFKETAWATEPPKKGLYTLVQTEWKPLSVPAVVFYYLSLSFLTLIPAWSTQDGYYVNYHLYADGEKRKTYRYEITRKTGMWIVLLPLVWVNLVTHSEADAFEATANQFFQDAAPVFAEFTKA